MRGRRKGAGRKASGEQGRGTRLALSLGVPCGVQVSTRRGGTAFPDLLEVGWDHVTEFGPRVVRSDEHITSRPEHSFASARASGDLSSLGQGEQQLPE